MIKLTDLISKHKITMTLKRVNEESLPKSTLQMWHKGAFHYNATLKVNGKQFTTEFHTGSGWTRQPETKDVLDCLLSDARSFKDTDFNSFTKEFGYTDKGKSNYAWKGCQKSYEGLQRLFGNKLDTFLYDVESL